MSDRRTREHRRKFQELINPENRSKRFRSDTPSSRGEDNNIPAKAMMSPAAEAKATISSAAEAS
jgi:hypothetical protein